MRLLGPSVPGERIGVFSFTVARRGQGRYSAARAAFAPASGVASAPNGSECGTAVRASCYCERPRSYSRLLSSGLRIEVGDGDSWMFQTCHHSIEDGCALALTRWTSPARSLARRCSRGSLNNRRHGHRWRSAGPHRRDAAGNVTVLAPRKNFVSVGATLAGTRARGWVGPRNWRRVKDGMGDPFSRTMK